MFKFLIRIAALVGIGYAAKQLSKKENRDRVVEEYNKAKEDPKQYAQNVQDKVATSATEYQEKAKEEYYKAKEDPKAYSEGIQNKAKDELGKIKSKSEDLQTKAKDELDKIKTNAEGKIQDIRKNKDGAMETEIQESRFDDETPAQVDIKQVDTDVENKENTKTIVTKKDDK